jgi:hypothetical protein
MITSWADKEDKTNAKYDSIRGKSKHNTGGNNNNSNKNHGSHNNNYSSPNRKGQLKSQTTQSWLYNTL